MASQQVLGRGLSALIGDCNDVIEDNNTDNDITYLPITSLEAGKFQARRAFDNDKIDELATSIKENGVILPLIVRKNKEDNNYQIIAGERRWRASKQVGLKEIPCIIKDIDDKEAMEVGLIENIQRQNLNPVEEAEGYKRLIEDFSYTHDEISSGLGKSRSHITNSIRLLQLPEEVLDLVSKNKITQGHARALVTSEDPVKLANDIVKKGLSVRQVEKYAKGSKQTKKADNIKVGNQEHTIISQIGEVIANNNSNAQKDEDLVILEKTMADKIGLKVNIVDSDQENKVEIFFNNLADLDKIIKSICSYGDEKN